MNRLVQCIALWGVLVSLSMGCTSPTHDDRPQGISPAEVSEEGASTKARPERGDDPGLEPGTLTKEQTRQLVGGGQELACEADSDCWEATSASPAWRCVDRVCQRGNANPPAVDPPRDLTPEEKKAQQEAIKSLSPVYEGDKSCQAPKDCFDQLGSPPSDSAWHCEKERCTLVRVKTPGEDLEAL